MNFSQITGHETIKNRLIHGVKSGRISHAQLFAGAPDSGALPLAIAYARYILCPARTNSDPCQECPTCYKTQKLEHADLHFIFPVNKSKQSTGSSTDKPISDHFIGRWREFLIQNGGVFSEREWYSYIDIENQQGIINKAEANELLRKMSFKSFEGGYKIVIIYLPERMNVEAANTLLKLIEEPPPFTLFLFVSENPDDIITTIRSRVQSISLPSLPSLKKLGRGDEELFDLFVELMRIGYTAKYIELFDWVDSIAPQGREFHKSFCENSIAILRECYMQGIGCGALAPVAEERQAFIANFAPFVNHLSVEALIAEFELLLRQIKQNGSAKILLTHFALMVSKILQNVKRDTAAGQ